MQEVVKVVLPLAGAHIVVLVLILIVVRRLLLGDTGRAVARLREVESEVRKKEEAIRREIEEHEKDFSIRKAEAEADLERQREKSEKEVATLRESTLSDSRKEAEKIIEQAKKNEQKFRLQILQDMETKAVEFGGRIFKLVFSERMNQELNRQFINELLDALEEVDSSSITVDPTEASFVSSHPLAPEQRTRLEQLLADKFGAKVKVQETVKEELMGGLIFKLGSLEIDGSLLNRFHEAAAEVKKEANV